MIEAWCEKHLGQKLPVTCCKDYAMSHCYDDRCVQVVANTGELVEEVLREKIVALQQAIEVLQGEIAGKAEARSLKGPRGDEPLKVDTEKVARQLEAHLASPEGKAVKAKGAKGAKGGG